MPRTVPLAAVVFLSLRMTRTRWPIKKAETVSHSSLLSPCLRSRSCLLHRDPPRMVARRDSSINLHSVSLLDWLEENKVGPVITLERQLGKEKPGFVGPLSSLRVRR